MFHVRVLVIYQTGFSPLYAPPGDVRQADSAVQHFYDKLVHIHERLKTVPGRKLGEKRHSMVGWSPRHSAEPRTSQPLP
jgi:hypothetical protein